MGRALPFFLFTYFVTNFCGLSFAEARIFNLDQERYAAYIEGTGGPSLVQKSSYERPDVAFTNSVDYNVSGEIGVLIHQPAMNFRIGVEAVRPQLISGAQATDAAGNVVYRVSSDLLALGPVAGVEYYLGRSNFRFFIGASAGYMNVTLKNDFEFTTAGQTAYSLPNYVEEASSWNVMGQGGLGFEFVAADTMTMSFAAGYRYLHAMGLKHERPANTLGGAVAPGDTMKNSVGTDRNIDLGGAWVGIGFRFYIRL